MYSNQNQTSKKLHNLLLWSDWRKTYASHIFPSNESLRWYLRHHLHELIVCGAAIKIKGQLHFYINEIDTAISEIAQKETLKSEGLEMATGGHHAS